MSAQSLTPATYAKLFCEVVASQPKQKQDAAIARFIEVVKNTGNEKRLAEIARECERCLRRQKKEHSLEIVSARALTARQKTNIKDNLPVHCEVTSARIDPTLIAGVRLIIDNDYLIDHSLNKAVAAIMAHPTH